MIKSKLAEMRKTLPKHTLIFPRPNDLETGLYYDDVKATVSEHIDGFCIPKVNNKSDILELCDSMAELESSNNLEKGSLKIIPQIETAESFINMNDIFTAGKSRIIAGAFGADDFLTDMGIERQHNFEELDFYRRHFVMNCEAHNLVSIDTPYVQFKNPEGLKQELAYLKSIGMKAKFAIHPLQIDTINETFHPSKSEIGYASRLVKEFEIAMEQGKAAIDFDNKMCDVPVYKRMLNVLKRAGLR